MKKIRVAVLMGGKSPEYEVSLSSGREVVKHLDLGKYEVLPVVISRDGLRWEIVAKEKLLHSPGGVEKRISSKFKVKSLKLAVGESQNFLTGGGVGKVDLVFIAMHGPYGEDGVVQGMLELLGLPYTGSGVLASALGMDKILSRIIFKSAKIPTPRFFVVEKRKFNFKKVIAKISSSFGFPVVTKPYNQGSSVGVTLVKKPAQLSQACQKVFSVSKKMIIDEYIRGVEVSCGVLGNDDPQALPVVEICPQKEFFDYEAKYTSGMSEEIVPARISKQLTQEVQKYAVLAFQAIGARGFARVDMFLKDGKTPLVSEINTIPGLTPNSLLPKEAASAGISYPQLLDKIIEFALESRKDTPGVSASTPGRCNRF